MSPASSCCIITLRKKKKTFRSKHFTGHLLICTKKVSTNQELFHSCSALIFILDLTLLAVAAIVRSSCEGQQCRTRADVSIKNTVDSLSHEHFYLLQLQHAEFYQVNQNKMKIMHTTLKINNKQENQMIITIKTYLLSRVR